MSDTKVYDVCLGSAVDSHVTANDMLKSDRSRKHRCSSYPVKPRPHQQQCRSNVRLCWSNIRLCCEKQQQCRTSLS